MEKHFYYTFIFNTHWKAFAEVIILGKSEPINNASYKFSFAVFLNHKVIQRLDSAPINW